MTTNRNGEIYLLDDRGRERERYPIGVGAFIRVDDKDKVPAKKIIAAWDPMNRPIIIRGDTILMESLYVLPERLLIEVTLMVLKFPKMKEQAWHVSK